MAPEGPRPAAVDRNSGTGPVWRRRLAARTDGIDVHTDWKKMEVLSRLVVVDTNCGNW